jgi:stearoyl-CoA desaturase (delta-9 desaturase)
LSASSPARSSTATVIERFKVDDTSTNEFVTTILTFGEGLHNNHHRFPRDVYISHAWYEFDLNDMIIRAGRSFVHNVFRASYRQLELAERAPDARATSRAG